jgi:uncharacterized protein YecT (DUF1311 family)
MPMQCFARNCEESAQNKSQLLDCLYQEQERSVDAAYLPLHAELAKRSPEAAKALEKSQASWRRFADDSCALYVLLETDTIPTDAQVNCWADFSQARVKVLTSWLQKLKAR